MRLEFTAGVNEPGYLPIHSETFTAAKEAWQFLADDFEAQEDLGLEDDGEVRQFASELRNHKGEGELKGPDGMVYFVLETLSYA